MPGPFRILGVLALAALLSAAPGLALAAEARASDDVRVSATCGRGATATLRLKADDGVIRIRFRVESPRSHSRWQVAMVREGRVVWRGRVRSDGGGSLDVTRRIRGLRGADQVIARALGPDGVTCIAVATVRG